jgi:hypothetical protein
MARKITISKINHLIVFINRDSFCCQCNQSRKDFVPGSIADTLWVGSVNTICDNDLWIDCPRHTAALFFVYIMCFRALCVCVRCPPTEKYRLSAEKLPATYVSVRVSTYVKGREFENPIPNVYFFFFILQKS